MFTEKSQNNISPRKLTRNDLVMMRQTQKEIEADIIAQHEKEIQEFWDAMNKATADYISQMGMNQQGEQDAVKPKKERKSERLNLTITPSNKAHLAIMSCIERISITQIIDNLVVAYIEENRKKIDMYNKKFMA